MRRAFFALILCNLNFSADAVVTFETAEALFLRANELFQAGISSQGPERSDKIQRAASLYERIVNEKGIRNGYIYYNLGNCYFHLGQIGKAILNYRRAERLIPNYSDLRRSLESARARRKDRIEKSQARSIAQTLFFWHYVLSLRTKIALFSVFFSAVWIVLLVRLFLNRAFTRWVLWLSIFSAVVFGVSGAVEAYGDNSTRFGVILVESAVSRKGPGESYAPSFKEPLHEGTEFCLRDEQGQWLRIELDNGALCWVSARAVELM